MKRLFLFMLVGLIALTSADTITKPVANASLKQRTATTKTVVQKQEVQEMKFHFINVVAVKKKVELPSMVKFSAEPSCTYGTLSIWTYANGSQSAYCGYGCGGTCMMDLVATRPCGYCPWQIK